MSSLPSHLAFELSIQGVPRPFSVGEFVVSEEAGAPGRLTAVVYDDLQPVPAEQVLGRLATLVGRTSEGPVTMFEGRVSQHQAGAATKVASHTTITAVHRGAVMRHFFGRRVFRGQTLHGMLRKIAKSHGLKITFRAPDKPLHWVYEQNEDDFDFFSRLLDENEQFAIFDGDGVTVLEAFDRAKPVKLSAGTGGLIDLSLRTRLVNGGRVARFHSVPQNTTADLRPGEAAATGDGALAASRSKDLFASPAPMRTQRRARTPQERSAQLERESRRAVRSRRSGDGVSVDLRVTPGATIEISKTAGAGKYGVVSATHVYANGAYQNRFVVTDADRFDRVAPLPERSVAGLVSAVVVSNRDPKRLGRVQVRFQHQDEDEATHWCRVSTHYAGGGRGAYVIPEEKDEVLVGFIDGDREQPVVVGAMWNGRHQPPKGAEGDNGVKIFQTRAGHRIEVREEGAGAGITVETKDRKTRLVLLDTGDARLSAQGSIRLEASEKLELIGGKGVDIGSNGPMKLAAKKIDLN